MMVCLSQFGERKSNGAKGYFYIHAQVEINSHSILMLIIQLNQF